MIEESPSTEAMRTPGRFVWRALLLLIPVVSPAAMHAQAEPTAVRKMDLQAGGFFTFGHSNYLPWDTDGNPAPLSDLTRTVRIMGGGGYVAADFKPHIGVEIDIRHLTGASNGGNQTSYELGGRYVFLRTASFAPYARVSYGRGVYAYPGNAAVMSFNLFGLSGGVDYHLTSALTLRGEYEWQSWIAVPLRNPRPQTATIGVAYHF